MAPVDIHPAADTRLVADIHPAAVRIQAAVHIQTVDCHMDLLIEVVLEERIRRIAVHILAVDCYMDLLVEVVLEERIHHTDLADLGLVLD
jgi:hypothetical protein